MMNLIEIIKLNFIFFLVTFFLVILIAVDFYRNHKLKPIYVAAALLSVLAMIAACDKNYEVLLRMRTVTNERQLLLKEQILSDSQIRAELFSKNQKKVGNKLCISPNSIDGWKNPFEIKVKGDYIEIISYGSDGKKGGYGFSSDVFLTFEVRSENDVLHR